MATQNSLNKTSDGFTSTAGLTANGGTISLATDATTSTINIGTGSGAKTSTFGSINSTSATTVQSGSGALNITSTNGIMTLASGTAALNISNDATATAVNIATGAAAKTVIVGSTNTTSSLALRYGTSDFTMASATGTVMSALDTGQITYPLQPCFFVSNSGAIGNVTGDGTVYTTPWDTETYDIGGNFASNTFTAPITGKYLLYYKCVAANSAAAYTSSYIQIVTTARTYTESRGATAANPQSYQISIYTDMTAGDTASTRLSVSGGAKVISFQGTSGAGSYVSYFCGNLVS